MSKSTTEAESASAPVLAPEALDRAANALRRSVEGSTSAFLYHAVCTLVFCRVWLWHLTPQAAALPGAQGFGWFFRYLTFCSFTLQTILFFSSCLSELVKSQETRTRLRAATNNLGCALFPIANTVTLMFYAVENATNGLVERGGFNRPDWLDFSVHSGNSLAAWGDILLSPHRDFAPQARSLAIALALAYSAWCLVVRAGYGKFPYPLLNKLPLAYGFFGFCVAGTSLVLFFFQVGAVARWSLRRRRSPARPVPTKKTD
ncbi:hypothetical protein ACKKBG_A17740 [Auxenochlorella protothecoides x Auxenochlorella symbiontica]